MDSDTSADGWTRLGLFLSRDVMERRYTALHGVSPDPGKAVEIISHLDQGRQYFRSAERAGVLAGPLEQYYGVLAFARAIVLYRNAAAREANLQKRHGLTARFPKNGELGDITIEVVEGTFDQLMDATANRELAAIDVPHSGSEPSRRQFVRSLPRPAVRATFLLRDLLSRIPGLREQYESALGHSAHCYIGRASIVGPLAVWVQRGQFNLPRPDELRAALALSNSWTAVVQPAFGVFSEGVRFEASIQPGNSWSALLPNIVEGRDLTCTIVEPFPGGWYLSEICAFTAASHMMSMLVRYYPTRWARLLAHEEGDSLVPVFERLRSLLQTYFIRLVLWELEPQPQGRE